MVEIRAIQVEHTVTEQVTGYDIVKCQMLIAAGRPLSDPAIGLGKRRVQTTKASATALQCRVTTRPGQLISCRLRPAQQLSLAGRHGHSPRRLRVHRRGHYALLRLAAGQGDGLRAKVHRRGRPNGCQYKSSASAAVKTNIPSTSSPPGLPVLPAAPRELIDETPALFQVPALPPGPRAGCSPTSARSSSTAPWKPALAAPPARRSPAFVHLPVPDVTCTPRCAEARDQFKLGAQGFSRAGCATSAVAADRHDVPRRPSVAAGDARHRTATWPASPSTMPPG